jgi:hypothetical protein
VAASSRVSGFSTVIGLLVEASSRVSGFSTVIGLSDVGFHAGLLTGANSVGIGVWPPAGSSGMIAGRGSDPRFKGNEEDPLSGTMR